MEPDGPDELCELVLSHNTFMRVTDTNTPTGILFSRLTTHVMRSYMVYVITIAPEMLNLLGPVIEQAYIIFRKYCNYQCYHLTSRDECNALSVIWECYIVATDIHIGKKTRFKIVHGLLLFTCRSL